MGWGGVAAVGLLSFCAPGAANASTAAASRGAVVVALGSDATDAAKPLARALYRDADLAAPVDDATARILVGEPLAPTATPAQKDFADLRASLGHGGSEAAERRLLASIGVEVHAAIVVSVTLADGRAHARILNVGTAAYSGTELGATASHDATGATIYAWPDATTTLRGILVPLAPQAEAPAPAAEQPASSGLFGTSFSKSSLKSPWFWAGLGGVVALGVSVFVIGKATSSSNSAGPAVNVTGTVPR